MNRDHDTVQAQIRVALAYPQVRKEDPVGEEVNAAESFDLGILDGIGKIGMQ